MKRSLTCLPIAVAVIVCHTQPCESAVISDLNSLIAGLSAGTRFDNDFDLSTTENYLVDDASLDSLDSSTFVPGYGTGIVSEGVRLSSTRADRNLVLLRQTGIRITSGAIYHRASSPSPNSTLRISFTTKVTHAGFDYFEFASANGRGATIDVWKTGASVADSFFVIPGVGTENREFFGFQNLGGIDYIDVTSEPYDQTAFSTIIDNLTFGDATAVPEPSSFVLISVGVLASGFATRRRRKRISRKAKLPATDEHHLRTGDRDIPC